MRVAIIEKNHFEVAYTLISLFDDGKNHITVFIDQKSYTQLQHLLGDKMERYAWIVQPDKERNLDFITCLFRQLRAQRFDLIYFSTISDNFIMYALQLKEFGKRQVILTLHDINASFHRPTSFHIKSWVRYWGRRRLIKWVPAFNVLADQLKEHLVAQLPAEKKVYTIPGGFFDPSAYVAPPTALDRIRIVVPGSVDVRRRDYDQVFALLQKAKEQQLSLDITLLGAFEAKYGQAIAQQCREYSRNGDNLHYFGATTVDQPLFDSTIQQGHFIWSPLRRITSINDGVPKEYGVSTVSGNMADMIRHARPFLAPDFLLMDNRFAKSGFAYPGLDSLTDFLLAMHLYPERYAALLRAAQDASLHFTLEKIRSRFPAIFG